MLWFNLLAYSRLGDTAVLLFICLLRYIYLSIQLMELHWTVITEINRFAFGAFYLKIKRCYAVFIIVIFLKDVSLFCEWNFSRLNAWDTRNINVCWINDCDYDCAISFHMIDLCSRKFCDGFKYSSYLFYFLNISCYWPEFFTRVVLTFVILFFVI